MMQCKVYFRAAVLLILMMLVSCSEPAGPSVSPGSKNTDYQNIEWTLSEVSAPWKKIDISGLPPFRIAILDKHIWARDDCNTMYSTMTLVNDTLLYGEGGVTLVGCRWENTFSFSHLYKRPLVRREGEKLILSVNDTDYVYTARFSGQLPKMDFLDKSLRLASSNDTIIKHFDTIGVFPELLIKSDRSFRLSYYNAPPKYAARLNYYKGIFGMDDSGDWQFLSVDSRFVGHIAYTGYLINDVLQADRFEYTAGSIKLINTRESLYYVFTW
ncbi:MAG: hypothetical protein FMNOHCHN_00417 [Ignavibacteriaceae bacterium]|nr:hypothetical protein [Ignavibacteriaceae bacterium]